jgi:predicted MPP superfamily phosphohydrolase
VRVDDDGAELWIAGISDLWTGHPDIAAALAKVSDDAPVIALTHNPDIFPDIPARVALTLAGHTHGGQVVLPFIGRPFIHSPFGARYTHGLVVEGTRDLFVTTGIGTSIVPVRFGVPPEIAVLTLD